MAMVFRNSGKKLFRNTWTAKAALERITWFEKVLVNVPPGYGKTYSIKKLIPMALSKGGFDLVQVYAPTHQVINELKLSKIQSSGRRIVILKPRPEEKCGSLNKKWGKLPSKGLGLLGKERICKTKCIHYCECFWPNQYGEQLLGADVVVGTQSHLERDPDFIPKVNGWVGAKSCLTILDEANFVIAEQERSISKNHIKRLKRVLSRIGRHNPNQHIGYLQMVCTKLLKAKADAPLPSIPRVNSLPINLMKKIQAAGVDKYGPKFRNILYDLQQLTRSTKKSRFVLADGTIRYAVIPKLTNHVIVYSATCSQELLESRLKTKFEAPFAREYKNHPETEVYNLANMIGAKSYFPKNMPQILDFYVGLIVKRVKQGKKIVLISKKHFAKRCAKEINKRLRELGNKTLKAKVITKKTKFPLKRNVLPIITYGIVGVNKFKKYDCIYCLNSYYAREDILSQYVQEELPENEKTEYIIVRDEKNNFFRRAVPLYPSESDKNQDSIAQMVLEELEIAVVLQALGRVRFHTKPREVIMFQRSSSPILEISKVFYNLKEARKHFGIKNRRQIEADLKREKIRLWKSLGLIQKTVSEKLGYSLRTVQRYWK